MSFPVNDDRSLADHLERLLTDRGLYDRIAREARLTVEQKFSLQNLRESIDREYRSLLQLPPALSEAGKEYRT